MNLQAALIDLIHRGDVLVATDFDGTIAPLAEHPNLVEVDNTAMNALLGLAKQPEVQVAIISGRPHRDLERLVPQSERIVLIGEHGNDAGTQQEPDKRVTELAGVIREIASVLDGSYVELKTNSVGLHWRQVTTDPTDVIAALEGLITNYPAFSVLRGKKLIEFTLGSRTKGDAVASLAEHKLGTLFLGDDTTDETVFEILGPRDVGVKVGEGTTLASYRVEDVAAVASLLEMLLEVSLAGPGQAQQGSE